MAFTVFGGGYVDPNAQALAAQAQLLQAAAVQNLAAARVAQLTGGAPAALGGVAPPAAGGNQAQGVLGRITQMLSDLMRGGGGSSPSPTPSTDSSSSSPSTTGSSGSSSSSSGAGGASGSGEAAAAEAKKFVGQDSQSLKGKLKNFEAAGGQTNNCADFVCSLLKNQDPSLPKTNSVAQLKSTLQSRGWKQVPKEQSKAGDVAFANTGSHVQLVSAPGKTIGSNNDRPGHQVVSERNVGNDTILSKA